MPVEPIPVPVEPVPVPVEPVPVPVEPVPVTVPGTEVILHVFQPNVIHKNGIRTY